MKKNKYKNITDKALTIIGVGVVEPDAVIETEKVINNPNLELVNEVDEKKEGEKVKNKKTV